MGNVSCIPFLTPSMLGVHLLTIIRQGEQGHDGSPGGRRDEVGCPGVLGSRAPRPMGDGPAPPCPTRPTAKKGEVVPGEKGGSSRVLVGLRRRSWERNMSSPPAGSRGWRTRTAGWGKPNQAGHLLGAAVP